MEVETDDDPNNVDEGTLITCILKLTGVRECTKVAVLSSNGTYQTNGPVQSFSEVNFLKFKNIMDLNDSVINLKVQNVTIVFTNPGL